jgi:hypothetical protein
LFISSLYSLGITFKACLIVLNDLAILPTNIPPSFS